GTGKELIARALHRLSPRADGPYVRVNCGALSESLLESELFGHVKGAFTGAVANKLGKFQAADGGTLFLDEIGEMPIELQVKLLRAIQEKVVFRVGDTRPETVDIRILAATNRELENRIKKALVLAESTMIGPDDLGLTPDVLPPILTLAEAKEKFQRDYINEVLALNNGNRTKTARDLGVDPRTVFRHLEKESTDLP
ncbi:MAG TPA: sigma-54-dependent Fis family transcriptional regulator, partial [Haliangium sp.]|nr:sigma-54-dependent Fis family transcriptional regulator [Haliangium sp.]